MNRIRRRPCRNCSDLFIPDHRNVHRQDFCGLPECRKASKAASHAKWLVDNPNYFKGAEHVERVREWRRAHPGYRRSKTTAGGLQESYQSKITEKQEPTMQLLPSGKSPGPVLQDLCLGQHPVFIGLISHILGCVLQDDIDAVLRRLEQLGQDIFIGSTKTTGGYCHDLQIPNPSRPRSPHSRTVQLGGSASGP